MEVAAYHLLQGKGLLSKKASVRSKLRACLQIGFSYKPGEQKSHRSKLRMRGL